MVWRPLPSARNHLPHARGGARARLAGGGNTGRNTTIVRSNYLFPESARLYDFSLRLYEGLARELNFNIMLSQRGLVLLAHSRHDLDAMARWADAMHMNGIDAQLLSREEVAARAPLLEMSPAARFPILGGFCSAAPAPRAMTRGLGVRARRRLAGVDIIQNCEVTGFLTGAGGRISGVQTSRGRIDSERIGIAAAGHSSVLAQLAGFRLPVTSYALQAMVTEPVKPALDTVVLSPGTGAYVSQSDKGEMVLGASLDLFPSYAQRGSFAVTQSIRQQRWPSFPPSAACGCCASGRASSTLCMTRARSSAPTPVPGLYINCGWGTGGFKGIPVGGWTLAHVLATGRNHELARAEKARRVRGCDRWRAHARASSRPPGLP